MLTYMFYGYNLKRIWDEFTKHVTFLHVLFQLKCYYFIYHLESSLTRCFLHQGCEICVGYDNILIAVLTMCEMTLSSMSLTSQKHTMRVHAFMHDVACYNPVSMPSKCKIFWGGIVFFYKIWYS